MQRHWLEVFPYCFHYATAGLPSNSPLLFLHGFLGDYREFAEVITILEEKFYCLAVDLPGHGQTQVSGDDNYYSMEKTAIALIQFLECLQIRRCGLLGYSMGGRLALYLGLHFPDYFSTLILESASPGLKTEIAQEQRREQDQEWINLLQNSPSDQGGKGGATLQEFLQHWYQQPLFNCLKNHLHFPKLLNQRLENNPQNLAKSLQYMGIGNQPNLWSMLIQGKVPLCLLVGEKDHKFVAINQQILTLYPQAKLSIFEHCGHNLHLENPVQFIAEVQTFLTEN